MNTNFLIITLLIFTLMGVGFAQVEFEKKQMLWDENLRKIEKMAIFTNEQLDLLSTINDEDINIINEKNINRIQFPVCIKTFVDKFGYPKATSHINNQRGDSLPVVAWKYKQYTATVCIDEAGLIFVSDVIYMVNGVSKSLIKR
jgi:hypothetical protein